MQQSTKEKLDSSDSFLPSSIDHPDLLSEDKIEYHLFVGSVFIFTTATIFCMISFASLLIEFIVSIKSSLFVINYKSLLIYIFHVFMHFWFFYVIQTIYASRAFLSTIKISNGLISYMTASIVCNLFNWSTNQSRTNWCTASRWVLIYLLDTASNRTPSY